MTHKLFFSFFAILFVCLAGCGQKERPRSGKPIVLTSIPPYSYFVQKIAGDTVDVHVVVPPGVNPHLFEPTPREFEKMKDAVIWVQIGEPFEKKMTKALQAQNPSIALLNLAELTPLIHQEDHCSHEHDEGHTHEGFDRHIWMSPALAHNQVREIKMVLEKAFPQFTHIFTNNLTLFLQELNKLDEEIAKELSPFRGEAILVSHPAFGYYCAEFGLRQLSIECEGKDPRPQDVMQVLSEAQKAHVRAVLLQPQYSNKGAELIAEKLNLPIYSIDPYAWDYQQNLRLLTHAITSSK